LLLEPDGPFYKSLANAVKLNGAQYVSYVDITPESPPLMIDGFEIVPSGAGNRQ